MSKLSSGDNSISSTSCWYKVATSDIIEAQKNHQRLKTDPGLPKCSTFNEFILKVRFPTTEKIGFICFN